MLQAEEQRKNMMVDFLIANNMSRQMVKQHRQSTGESQLKAGILP